MGEEGGDEGTDGGGGFTKEIKGGEEGGSGGGETGEDEVTVAVLNVRGCGGLRPQRVFATFFSHIPICKFEVGLV